MVGKALRLFLEKELVEFQTDDNDGQGVRFIGRNIDSSTQCYYCTVTLIGVAWMCDQCGHEAGVDCYKSITSNHQEEAKGDQQNGKLNFHHQNFHHQSNWIKELKLCVTDFESKHNPPVHFKISH